MLLDCLKASIQKFLVNKLLQPMQINTVFCNVLPLQTPMSFKEGGRTEGGREERRKKERKGERERNLLSANSLLKILIPLKAPKGLFPP